VNIHDVSTFTIVVTRQQARMAAAPPAMAVAAAAPPAFALFPGRATITALDFNNSDDVKLYKTAITAMTTPFNLAPIGLTQFLSNVQDRATEFGWENLLTVPTGPATARVNRNIITDYGLITMADCEAHAATYFAQTTRQAQNSAMLYTFLSKSLTEEARMLVFAFKGDFMRTSQTIGSIGVGILLFKTIIGKAVVDSAATVDTLRNSISSLDAKMVDLQSNIKQFNLHVINIRNGLIARGELVPELMTNLFKAYAKASDEEFVDYMKTKKFSHFDGTTNETADSLMTKALAHYEASVERGTWNAPNEKDAKIVALIAENAKLKKKRTDKTSAPASGNSDPGKNAWKKVKPKSGETTKVVGDSTWNWCKFHTAWVRHEQSSCFLDPDHKKKDTTEVKAPNMKLDPALQALIDEDDDSQT
jgi:hypothetical protein